MVEMLLLAGVCAQTVFRSAAQDHSVEGVSPRTSFIIPSTFLKKYHYSMESADLDAFWSSSLQSHAWPTTNYEIENDIEIDGQTNYRLSHSFEDFDHNEISLNPSTVPAWYEENSLLPNETPPITGQLALEPWTMLQSSGGIQEVEDFPSRPQRFCLVGSWNNLLPSPSDPQPYGDKQAIKIFVRVRDFWRLLD